MIRTRLVAFAATSLLLAACSEDTGALGEDAGESTFDVGDAGPVDGNGSADATGKTDLGVPDSGEHPATLCQADSFQTGPSGPRIDRRFSVRAWYTGATPDPLVGVKVIVDAGTLFYEGELDADGCFLAESQALQGPAVVHLFIPGNYISIGYITVERFGLAIDPPTPRDVPATFSGALTNMNLLPQPGVDAISKAEVFPLTRRPGSKPDGQRPRPNGEDYTVILEGLGFNDAHEYELATPAVDTHGLFVVGGSMANLNAPFIPSHLGIVRGLAAAPADQVTQDLAFSLEYTAQLEITLPQPVDYSEVKMLSFLEFDDGTAAQLDLRFDPELPLRQRVPPLEGEISEASYRVELMAQRPDPMVHGVAVVSSPQRTGPIVLPPLPTGIVGAREVGRSLEVGLGENWDAVVVRDFGWTYLLFDLTGLGTNRARLLYPQAPQGMDDPLVTSVMRPRIVMAANFQTPEDREQALGHVHNFRWFPQFTQFERTSRRAFLQLTFQ